MNTRTERHTLPNGFAEVGTITHEGRDFSAGGASVTDEAIVVYPAEPTQGHGTAFVTRGDVFNSSLAFADWGDTKLGTYIVTGHATGFRNITGRRTKLTCYRVRLDDGREYVGRGLGAGMILRARRARAKGR